MSIRIGVLNIQGSVEEHIAALKRCGATAVKVKSKKDLDGLAGLIIPGGESTVIGKLMKKYGLDKEIKRLAGGLAVWGTCAGAILLAKSIRGKQPDSLNLMDIEIERNAYGRQMDSFETMIDASLLGGAAIPAVFIRAPIIKRAFKSAKILASYGGGTGRGGHPVMARQKNMLATTFHPELTDDLRVHKYFITMANDYAGKKFKN